MITLCVAKIPRFEQGPAVVQVEGEFDSGDALADALIAKIPENLKWRSLRVEVQVFALGQESRKKGVISAFGLRSEICHEFDGLKQRGARPITA